MVLFAFNLYNKWYEHVCIFLKFLKFMLFLKFFYIDIATIHSFSLLKKCLTYMNKANFIYSSVSRNFSVYVFLLLRVMHYTMRSTTYPLIYLWQCFSRVDN